jgi:hypothetical protein
MRKDLFKMASLGALSTIVGCGHAPPADLAKEVADAEECIRHVANFNVPLAVYVHPDHEATKVILIAVSGLRPLTEGGPKIAERIYTWSAGADSEFHLNELSIADFGRKPDFDPTNKVSSSYLNEAARVEGDRIYPCIKLNGLAP